MRPFGTMLAPVMIDEAMRTWLLALPLGSMLRVVPSGDAASRQRANA